MGGGLSALRANAPKPKISVLLQGKDYDQGQIQDARGWMSMNITVARAKAAEDSSDQEAATNAQQMETLYYAALSPINRAVEDGGALAINLEASDLKDAESIAQRLFESLDKDAASYETSKQVIEYVAQLKKALEDAS